MVGILAAIAIPNFMKYQARAKQTECKVGIRSAYTAETSYYLDQQQYSEEPEKIGFIHDGRRAVFVFSAAGKGAGETPEAQAARAHVTGTLGVQGQCPDCQITIACAANIDNDPQIDVWSVSSVDRVGRHGQPIPAGTPYNDFNDMTDEPGE
jgi:type II secretory pathway pseudopilin PulG